MENNHFENFFQIFYFLIFAAFLNGLASNTQVNANIKKHQLPSNGATNSIGRIRVLKFITQV